MKRIIVLVLLLSVLAACATLAQAGQRYECDSAVSVEKGDMVQVSCMLDDTYTVYTCQEARITSSGDRVELRCVLPVSEEAPIRPTSDGPVRPTPEGPVRPTGDPGVILTPIATATGEKPAGPVGPIIPTEVPES